MAILTFSVQRETKTLLQLTMFLQLPNSDVLTLWVLCVNSICIFKLTIIILISIRGLKPLLARSQYDLSAKVHLLNLLLGFSLCMLVKILIEMLSNEILQVPEIFINLRELTLYEKLAFIFSDFYSYATKMLMYFNQS